MRTIQAVILDFDGLIVDTETPEFQSWRDVFAAHGAPFTLDGWARFIGTADLRWDPYSQLEQAIGGRIDRIDVRARRRTRFAELLAGQPIRPGVESYLRDAARFGLGIGLASSSSREWVEGHLREHGLLGRFDIIKASDDVTRTKPDPEVYRLVLDDLAVTGDRAIALEDSPNGIRAAKAAGIFCVAVPNQVTRTLRLDEADLRLESLADLPLAELLALASTR